MAFTHRRSACHHLTPAEPCGQAPKDIGWKQRRKTQAPLGHLILTMSSFARLLALETLVLTRAGLSRRGEPLHETAGARL